MKLSKETTQQAKSLLRVCMVDGRLDETRVREVVKKVSEQKPRNYLGVLTLFSRFVRLEIEKRTVTIESATPLDDASVNRITQALVREYGEGLTTIKKVNTELLGGVRVRVGSDVFDGSIANRLNILKESL
ncbi:MAG: F0F1 ATP synthase subunit delta [Verrucomicrobiota bacterium]|mgnify:CR=1 FL=1|nr:F0F1 ATP synthase subunit delta [Verrucomicrobiota bacterium]